jgi:hypothetical protein
VVIIKLTQHFINWLPHRDFFSKLDGIVVLDCTPSYSTYSFSPAKKKYFALTNEITK